VCAFHKQYGTSARVIKPKETYEEVVAPKISMKLSRLQRRRMQSHKLYAARRKMSTEQLEMTALKREQKRATRKKKKQLKLRRSVSKKLRRQGRIGNVNQKHYLPDHFQ
jgi:hypothetical protein